MPRRPSRKPSLAFSSPEPPADCLTATIDGAARGNPGPAAYGVVFEDASGKVVAELASRLGKATNNIAEYRALLAALAYARAQGWRALKVRTDSELLARQMRGDYRVRDADLKALHEQARPFISGLDYFAIEAVPRKQTRAADKLANAALDQRPRKNSFSPAASSSRAESRDAAGKKKSATGRSPWPERVKTIRAVYRDGVLKPLESIDLTDGEEIELQLRPRKPG